jgi:hypothetical protein
MIQRLFGWWRFSEALAGRLAQPHRNTLVSDAAVWEVIRSSRVFSVAQEVVATVAWAWRSSRVRRLSESVECLWRAGSDTDRVQRVGRCASAAAVTVLFLQTIESAQGAPFRWMLPLAFGVAGVLTELASGPLARAWHDKRR